MIFNRPGRLIIDTGPEFLVLDHSKGRPQFELQVEKRIFSLNGNVTNQLKRAKPFVFGMNKS